MQILENNHMKFIHLADAHLDSPFRGLSFLPSEIFNAIYQAADQSFARIVDLALVENVDLFLIAGDTFDSNRPSPKSQVFFAKQIKRLTDAKIQVVMIFGNHDHMKQEDLLVESSPYFKLLGLNEKVESVNFKTKNGFEYQVNGFSYLNNHIREDKLPEFPRKSNKFTFGLMHAQVENSQSNMNVYAPFSVKEMKELAYDYFALGHIHARQNLSEAPMIVYPGNIQGRHKNESGAKGCYLGTIDEESFETKVSFKETDSIVWKRVNLSLDGQIGKTDLQAAIINQLTSRKMTFFTLKITGANYLTDEEVELLQDPDYWRNISGYLKNNSQLVDIDFEVGKGHLELNSEELKALNQAVEEVFASEEGLQIAVDWAKKDPLHSALISYPGFIDQVKETVKFKMAQELMGKEDASQKD